MRRTITLLTLALCCVAAILQTTSVARGARNKKGNTQPAGAAGAGSPAPLSKEATTLVGALNKLKVATGTAQKDPEAARLKEQIEERLKAGYGTHEALRAMDADIQRWRVAADDLCTLKSLCGSLVENIRAVDAANTKFREVSLTQDGGDSTLPPSHGDESAKALPESTAALVSSEVNRLWAEKTGADAGGVSRWLGLGVMVGTPLLAVGLFAFALVSLNRTRREMDDMRSLTHQALVNLRSKQEASAAQLETLTAANADQSTRLSELSADIGAVSHRVQGLRVSAAGAVATASAYAPGDGVAVREPEPPAFPVAAEAYLRKMQRHATVVKPDFHNGILVADAENKGELALVQDQSISHDSLFVIPRATQFQMKQDFYTYYERYYDCERPASGTVWIVDPAVVERVQGGWALREKGLLEVR